MVRNHSNLLLGREKKEHLTRDLQIQENRDYSLQERKDRSGAWPVAYALRKKGTAFNSEEAKKRCTKKKRKKRDDGTIVQKPSQEGGL